MSAREVKQPSREQKGCFVSLCWIGQIHKHFESPKASYAADWEDLSEWQRRKDTDIFEAIERGVLQKAK